jgi:Zn finger protein HypA/HybF involved in hydrogenase expression
MPERLRSRSAHDLQLWIGACVRAIADAAHGRRVGAVVLGLGRDVDPARVRAVWMAAADDPALTGTSLRFVPNTHVLVCLGCRHEYQGGRLARCASCGGSELVVAPTPPVTVIDWEVAVVAVGQGSGNRPRPEAESAHARTPARGRS